MSKVIGFNSYPAIKRKRGRPPGKGSERKVEVATRKAPCPRCGKSVLARELHYRWYSSSGENWREPCR